MIDDDIDEGHEGQDDGPDDHTTEICDDLGGSIARWRAWREKRRAEELNRRWTL